jgi:hypothetical protein
LAFYHNHSFPDYDILPCARLSDIRGRKRIFQIGIVLNALASILRFFAIFASVVRGKIHEEKGNI